MFRINGERLWQRMMEMAQIGATPAGGVCRVALTDEDRKGRDLFVSWCENAGCSVQVDQMGNLFARKDGKQNDLPPVLIGSHLDSQPTGGKYDGVYGVLAALEVVETLNDQGLLTQHPIEVVSWTNEEGARFAPAMIGSGVFSGDFSLEYAYDCKDPEGIRLGDALEEIGFNGKLSVKGRDYHAAFELHIEQGPILEIEKKQIGVVTGVQGIRWYDLIIKGKETHAGPSPMSYRKDPVRASIPLLEAIYTIAEKYAPEARATVGYANAFPGVRNTVPGQLTISIDLRHPENQQLEAMHQELQLLVNRETPAGISVELSEIWHSPPVVFDPKCVQAVQKATEDLSIPAMPIVSGAGHDAVYVSKVVPTSMIFIPCEDGLSHNEKEHAEKADVIAGADVLLQAVLAVDVNGV